MKLPEPSDHFLGQSVSDKVLAGIATHILERSDRQNHLGPGGQIASLIWCQKTRSGIVAPRMTNRIKNAKRRRRSGRAWSSVLSGRSAAGTNTTTFDPEESVSSSDLFSSPSSDLTDLLYQVEC